MSKRDLIFVTAAPVAVFVAFAVIKKRLDVAGTAIATSPGFVLQFRGGLLVETMLGGLLVARLTA